MENDLVLVIFGSFLGLLLLGAPIVVALAAAALAAETAAAFARLGRWLYARDPSLANLAMLLSRTEEKTALSL